ncbi:carbamoyl-phosphate synthase [Aureococcus anophagefferens]|nr:carbamoyl-phosphate synthase [Aureococcus anophagefferens]
MMRRLIIQRATPAGPRRAQQLSRQLRTLRPLAALQRRKPRPVAAALRARGGVVFSSSSKNGSDPSTYARVAIVLEDGSVFEGRSFGAEVPADGTFGEVVFQTGMVGYAEALTDPSYRGQCLTMTYPMVGNYGVPDETLRDAAQPLLPRKTFESEAIHATAVVCQDYSADYSHWDATQSLGAWLAKSGVPGVTGVDTRRLTKVLRERGSMLGRIERLGDGGVAALRDVDPAAPESVALRARHLVDEVSLAAPKLYEAPNERLKVVAVDRGAGNGRDVDCGMKANMVRELNARGVSVLAVPWDHDFDGVLDDYDGLFLSNGPGDPEQCAATIAELRKTLAREGDAVRPVFGICLGNQLTGLAAGAKTTKLRFGNRGQNQPVLDALHPGACMVTSQNHGFAVDDTDLPEGWRTLYTNANDGSNEGLVHASKPYFTAQFHPEANGGPTDAYYLFDVFVDACSRHKAGRVPGGAAPAEALVWPKMASSAPQPEFPKKVLLLGSGGLSIGQAGEFDYSGAQAIKALKEEGVEVVLMNPNIASVQTNVDPGQVRGRAPRGPAGAADRVFFLPVTPPYVESVIAKEKPDAVLISMGGQTALNCGIELDHSGVLSKHGVRVLGTSIDTVIATEDREIFKNKCLEIDEPCANSLAVDSVAGARGGRSGICADAGELEALATKALAVSPQLLIEKSMLGWKEVECEVVRRRGQLHHGLQHGELRPLGVHTGDSIVVAPSQTLSNEEYHMLRSAALRVVRHLGIVGECNIQYALHPTSLEYCIIEVNPRLSRSSALASKATGYPLAFVAAKLAMGVTLPELRNSVTGGATIMGFEPALDYCVTKFPRWDLSKFAGAQRVLGSAMASVGEVMAIGRTFEESFQKALRMVDPANPGFEPVAPLDTADAELERKLVVPTDRRVWSIAEAMYRNAGGWDKDRVRELTKIDDWFLSRLEKIAALGFTDDQIAKQLGTSDDAVRAARKALGVTPVVKQIDTLAAEYAAQTNYLYTTYHGDDDDAGPLDGLAAPCATLYFEELSKERVMDIYDMEKVDNGVVVSMGGQIPQNLAVPVHEPKWAELESHASAVAFADDVGYPVLVRPSFVLSGAAMKVCRDEASLRAHLDVAKEAHEHAEDAGVHSGDATLLLPPQSLSDYTLNRARDATAEVVRQLNISGPFNIQFLVGGRARDAESRPEDELDGSFPSMNDVRIIECNLRASRSVPFVSKATGVDFADVATRVLAGLPLPDPAKLPQLYPTAGAAPENFVAVKAPMFSFSRLRGADPALGVEMSSTGEVACFGKDKEEAFLKALLATTMKLPTAGDGEKVLTSARGVPCAEVAFPTDAGDAPGGPDDAVALIRDGKIKLAVNLHAPESTRLADNYLIRRAAADFNIALVTNAQVFEMIAASLTKHAKGEILAANPTDLFSYYENEAATDAWTQKDEFH